MRGHRENEPCMPSHPASRRSSLLPVEHRLGGVKVGLSMRRGARSGVACCDCATHNLRAASSVCSLPPCGGGLGRGVVQRENDRTTCEGIARPPPPSPPHKGEGSAPSARRGCASSMSEDATAE